MNKILKNKKIIILILVLSLAGYFVFSDLVSAQEFAAPKLPTGPDLLPRGAGTAGGAGGILKAGGTVAAVVASKAADLAIWGMLLLFILNVTLWLMNYLFTAASAILNTGFQIALDPRWFNGGAVLEAWKLVRDLTNVGIILVLLFIALATILRISNYQAKKLLPAIIAISLVINFSLPISKFVIDISNVIAFQFVKQIGDQKGDIAANIANGLKVQNIINQADVKTVQQGGKSITPPTSPQQQSEGEQGLIPKANAQLAQAVCFGIGFASAGVGGLACQAVAAVVGFFGLHYGSGWATQALNSVFSSSVVGSVQSYGELVVANILTATAVFIMAAIGFLVLARTVILMLVLVLSPLGLLSSVLPDTQQYWKKWLNYLLSQSFFLPAITFLLWFALKFMAYTQTSLDGFAEKIGFNRLAEDPTSPRLVFFIMSWVLLFMILPLARDMGAFGASTMIKWFDFAKGAITGFVGGFAARKFVAPLGTAITAASMPEVVGRISPVAGVKARDFAEWLAKRGKAPEKALEKAELGMRLAPAERAAYFAKLDRAAKEAMLRKMKAEERSDFISTLGAKNLAVAQEARAILRSGTFAPEERAKTEAEEFKYSYTLPEQWKKFGSLSENIQKQFLLGIEDADKRAQFLDHVRDESVKADNFNGMSAFQNANTFLETSGIFSANQQYANRLARFKVEHNENQKINRLAEFFASRPESEWKTRFRFAANDSQRLELVEDAAAKNNIELLKKLQGWIREMDPADQDKFDRDWIGKRASLQTVVKYIQSVDTGNPARDFAIKKQILSGASAQQLGSVAREIPELEGIADDISRTISLQNQSAYKQAKGKPPPTPPPAPVSTGIPPRTPLPSELSNAITNKNTNITVDQINKTTNADLIQEVISRIQKANDPEFTATIERRINPIFKVQYIDNIDYNSNQFEEALKQTIRESHPFDLQFSITKEVELDPKFQKAFVGSINPEQLFVLGDRPNLINALKHSVSGNELLKTSLAENVKQITGLQDEENIKMMIMQDPHTHAEAIAETFETEFRNEKLGYFIAHIRSRPGEILPDYQKWLKEKLFGKE